MFTDSKVPMIYHTKTDLSSIIPKEHLSYQSGHSVCHAKTDQAYIILKWMYVHIHAHVMCMYRHAYACTNACMHMYVCIICMIVCMYVFMYVYV